MRICPSGDCRVQRLLRSGSGLSIRILYFMVLFFALYLLVAIIDELFLSATLNLRNFPWDTTSPWDTSTPRWVCWFSYIAQSWPYQP